MILIAGISMLFALSSCKKGTDAPPAGTKKTEKQALEESGKKATKEVNGTPSASEGPAPEEKEAKKEAEKEAEKEEAAPPPAAERPPQYAEKNSAVCKDRIEAEDRRIKREVIPMMRAEQDAMEAVTRWAQKAYDVLEPEESALAKVKIDDFWKEYGTCVKELGAPKAERDPECVAYVTADASACQRLGNDEIRKRCADTVRTKAWEKNIFDWAKAGFSADFCAQPAKTADILPPVLCPIFAQTGDCSPQAFTNHLATMCRAAKAGFRGEECGDEFPADSQYCRFLAIVKADNRVELCKRESKAGSITLPDGFCDAIAQVANEDCKQLLTDTPPDAPAFPEAECSLLKAIRNGTMSCEGLYAADSDDCAMLISTQAALAGDSSLCDGLKSRERAHMRCRTFLSTSVKDCDLKTSSEWGTGPKDDTPCRRLLWEKTVLPASEGRAEVRLTLVNPFDNTAKCSVEMKVAATGATSTQTENVDLKKAEVKVHSLFYLGGPDAKVEIIPTCTWDRVIASPPEEKAK